MSSIVMFSIDEWYNQHNPNWMFFYNAPTSVKTNNFCWFLFLNFHFRSTSINNMCFSKTFIWILFCRKLPFILNKRSQFIYIWNFEKSISLMGNSGKTWIWTHYIHKHKPNKKYFHYKIDVQLFVINVFQPFFSSENNKTNNPG